MPPRPSARGDELMRYKLFGGSGLRVSELFLGAMTFGEQGGVGAPPQECRRILDAYADAGGNVIDTAINYRGGASEEILGELLQGRRDRFVLATKYTVTRDAADPNAAGNHRKNLRLSLETSLRRLRTDYIDIYWVHMWDAGTPLEETMRALDDQVRAGKILYVGISDAPAWVIARANTLADGAAGPPSPACRRPTACCTATSSANCCPWPRPSASPWPPGARWPTGSCPASSPAQGAAGQHQPDRPAALSDTSMRSRHWSRTSPTSSASPHPRSRSPGPGPGHRYSPDHRRPPPRPADRQPRRPRTGPARRRGRPAGRRHGVRPRLPATFIRGTGHWVFGAAGSGDARTLR